MIVAGLVSCGWSLLVSAEEPFFFSDVVNISKDTFLSPEWGSTFRNSDLFETVEKVEDGDKRHGETRRQEERRPAYGHAVHNERYAHGFVLLRSRDR